MAMPVALPCPEASVTIPVPELLLLLPEPLPLLEPLPLRSRHWNHSQSCFPSHSLSYFRYWARRSRSHHRGHYSRRRLS